MATTVALCRPTAAQADRCSLSVPTWDPRAADAAVLLDELLQQGDRFLVVLAQELTADIQPDRLSRASTRHLDPGQCLPFDSPPLLGEAAAGPGAAIIDLSMCMIMSKSSDR